jgi:carbamoyl-phosphate synthase large subunit
MKKKLILLISCASNKVHTIQYIESVLSRFNTKSIIFVSDRNSNSIIKNFDYKFYKIPDLLDINKVKILKICKKKKIDIVIPTSDLELLFWSKHKVEFKDNKIYPMISDHKTISICQDKWLFYKLLKKNKIKTPKSFLFLKNIINKNKKFIIKERNSLSKNKTYYKNINFKDLRNKILLFKKPIIQEYILGKEISIDIFIKNEVISKDHIIMRYRDNVKFGESEKTTIFKNNSFLKEIINLLKLFNFEGHIMFQAIISKKRISIIECNPRIGGASVSSMVWGLDSVAQFIKSKFNIKYKKLKANKSESMIIYKKTKFI